MLGGRRKGTEAFLLAVDFRSYQDFAVLAVSIDRRGKLPVAQFMANNGYNFSVVLDAENVASGAYGVSGIPSTFVIGRHGRIMELRRCFGLV
jgi:hypothetical protein